MSVKTLRRITRQQRNIVAGIDEPHTNSNVLSRIVGSINDEGTEFLRRIGRHRKSADDMPLSILDRIKESIVFNAPALASVMNNETLRTILGKLKLPLIATLGIAFISGLAYLAYKLYSNYTSQKKEETIETIMKDIEETAPDLLNVEGWRESIRNEIEEAVSSSNPSTLVEKIAAIKASVMNHQKSINPSNMGSGINLFKTDTHKRKNKHTYMHTRTGRGLRVPM